MHFPLLFADPGEQRSKSGFSSCSETLQKIIFCFLQEYTVDASHKADTASAPPLLSNGRGLCQGRHVLQPEPERGPLSDGSFY